MSLGALAVHGFGNIFAMARHPGKDVVRYANQVNGRAEDHVNSITTTLCYIPELFAGPGYRIRSMRCGSWI